MGFAASGANWAEERMKNEAVRLENQRAYSLEALRAQHAQEEETRREGFATEAEKNRESFATQAEKDRQSFETGHYKDQDKLARDLAAAQATREDLRQKDGDRKLVQQESETQLAALTKRVQTINDDLRQGKYVDPADAQDEIGQAQDQMRKIRARTIRTLKDLGDPRYKDMTNTQTMLLAGFSKPEVAALLRSEASASLEGGTENADTASAPPADAGMDQDIGAAMGGPASNATTLPTSPAPLDNMSKAGRGRGLPTSTVQTRGGPQEMLDWGKIFGGPATPGPGPRFTPGQPTRPRNLFDPSRSGGGF
jgi:multidrug efflux pump subunit AcrA (membrane-fusion protein)